VRQAAECTRLRALLGDGAGGAGGDEGGGAGAGAQEAAAGLRAEVEDLRAQLAAEEGKLALSRDEVAALTMARAQVSRDALPPVLRVALSENQCFVEGKGATCLLGMGGGIRRVRLVWGEGRGVSDQYGEIEEASKSMPAPLLLRLLFGPREQAARPALVADAGRAAAEGRGRWRRRR
jgi:hypothetical protein